MNLDLLRQEFKLQEMNRRLECGVFLWADGTVPVELNADVAPSRSSDSKYAEDLNSISLQVNTAVGNHPEIQRDLMRIDQQQVDLRLKREMLKPILNLKYNALNEPVGNNLIANYSLQNYTWGLDFAIPILLRKERAGVKIAELKLQDMNFALDYKRALILMKAQASLNEWQIMTEQLSMYQRNLTDINKLLAAERSLFDNGESSVFLVNTREMVLVNAQIKLYEYIAKSQKSIFKSYYSLALLESL
jgi:outer membrane protein TolC